MYSFNISPHKTSFNITLTKTHWGSLKVGEICALNLAIGKVYYVIEPNCIINEVFNLPLISFPIKYLLFEYEEVFHVSEQFY